MNTGRIPKPLAGNTAPRNHGGGCQPGQLQHSAKGWILSANKPRLDTDIARLLQQFATAPVILYND